MSVVYFAVSAVHFAVSAMHFAVSAVHFAVSAVHFSCVCCAFVVSTSCVSVIVLAGSSALLAPNRGPKNSDLVCVCWCI